MSGDTGANMKCVPAPPQGGLWTPLTIYVPSNNHPLGGAGDVG